VTTTEPPTQLRQFLSLRCYYNNIIFGRVIGMHDALLPFPTYVGSLLEPRYPA
jgi:hypothetical protein